MRIGFVRKGYSSSGGAEQYLIRLSHALAERGHSPVLFAEEGWPAERWPGREIVRLKGGRPREFSDEVSRWRTEVDVLFSLERIASCDIYRAGDGLHAAWLERRARFEPAWKGWIRRLSPKHREILQLERLIFEGGARRIIANSTLVRNEITARYDCPAERIRRIPNGVPEVEPVTYEERTAARERLGIQADEVCVLFLGSGWERKGLRFALEAVRALNSVTMLVAGRGKRPGDCPPNARFLGEVSSTRELFAACDSFLLPTLYDPFSNASLEAAAHGLPVLTTSANGFSEYICSPCQGEVLRAPDDVEAMRRAILRLGILEEERRSVVAGCVSELTIESNANASLRVIEEVIE